MVWLAAALLLFIIQMATVLILEFRHPAKTMAWLLILYILPIVGFVMYYFFARDYSTRKKVRRAGGRLSLRLRRELLRKLKPAENPEDLGREALGERKRLFRQLASIPDAPITCCNQTEILTNAGAAYEAILEAMAQARDHIHLEYYTIRHDGIGGRFRDMLVRKAEEGVKVRVIYDGVGSYQLSREYLASLNRAGVEAFSFLPPIIAFFDKRINYRNHRKNVVIDGRIGFLGGINIGDEYLGQDPKLGFWRDTHVKVEGDAVFFLQKTFLADWAIVSGQRLSGRALFPSHQCTGDSRVQIIASGPDLNRDTILGMYFGAITTAQHRVYIATPYFIPDPGLLLAIKSAAASGLDVRIILPGVSDSRLVKWASMSYLEELMDAGVRIYQYRRGFMHAKVLLVDDLVASVGTANMDMRSLFDNFELNAVLFDEKSLKRLADDFHQDLKDSEEIDPESFKSRSRWQKGREVIARMLSPLL